MKVLLVLHGFPPETQGGTERAVEALARAMLEAGHEAVVVAGSLEPGRPDRIGSEDRGGLRVRRLHRDDLDFEQWFKAYAPGVSAAFEGLLAEERPDVVHVHHWQRLSSDLVRLARAAGCATAVTLHDYFTALATPVRRAGRDRPEPPPSPPWVGAAEAAEALAFHRRDFLAEVCAADLRCAPSRSHAEGLQQLAAGPLGAIEVTPPPLLQAPPRRPARAGPRGRRLLAWGTWYDEKGLEVVLDALAAAPGWSLEVWGEAHEASHTARLRERARDLPVAWRGAFRARDLARTEADYAVLPSLCHESYGLTLDEALLLGLPVLASDLPVYRERAPSASCAHFAPGDAASLAALLRDEDRLRRLEAPGPPAVVDAAGAAAALLALYERARRGELPAAPAAEEVSDRERAALLFRRAERRLWTARWGPGPPPDDFPGPPLR